MTTAFHETNGNPNKLNLAKFKSSIVMKSRTFMNVMTTIRTAIPIRVNGMYRFRGFSDPPEYGLIFPSLIPKSNARIMGIVARNFIIGPMGVNGSKNMRPIVPITLVVNPAANPNNK
jgi:hypothetical protein